LLSPQANKTDGVRYHTDADNMAIHNYIELFLKQHKVKHIKCDFAKDPNELILEIFNINIIPELPTEIVIVPDEERIDSTTEE